MKAVVLFLISICAVCAFALTEEELGQKWKDYKKQFGKSYSKSQEDDRRKQIFRETLKLIEEHNKKYEQGSVSYKLGINQFSDLTAEEQQASKGLLVGGVKPIALN